MPASSASMPIWAQYLTIIIAAMGLSLSLYQAIRKHLDSRLSLSVRLEAFSYAPATIGPSAELGKWDSLILGIILINNANLPVAVSEVLFWTPGQAHYAYMTRKRLDISVDRPFQDIFTDLKFPYEVFSTPMPINIDAYSAVHAYLAFKIPAGTIKVPQSPLLTLRTNKGQAQCDIAFTEDAFKAAADWLAPIRFIEGEELRSKLLDYLASRNNPNGSAPDRML